MKKLEEMTNEELLDCYFRWRMKDDDIDYITYFTEEYIKHVEKQFDRVEIM